MLTFWLLSLCFSGGKSDTFQQIPRVRVLTSAATPVNLLQAAFLVQSRSGAFVVTEDYQMSDASSTARHYDGVLDLLWSESLSRQFLSSADPEVPILNGGNYHLEGTISLDIDSETELKVLSQVSEWLKVLRICVFLTPQSPHLQLVKSLFEGITIEILRIHEDITSIELNSLIRRLIIPFGFTSFLVTLPPQTTKKLLIAFEESQMTSNPLIILLSSRAAQYRFTLGSQERSKFEYTSSLFVTKRGCIGATRIEDLLLCQVKLALSTLNSSETLLMKIHNRTVVDIGSVNDHNIEISKFEENSLRPNRSDGFLPIIISANVGGVDNNGSIQVTVGGKGVALAVAEVNSRTTLLPFYTLLLANLTLGVDVFNASWVLSQLAHSDLGVAHLPGPYSVLASSVYTLLKNINKSVPQVGAVNTLPELSSATQFPLFTRVIVSDVYFSIVYTRMITFFNWKRVCIIHNDNLWSETLAQLVIDEAHKLNIEICNTHRRVSTQVQSNSTELLEVIQEVVDSRVRVLILLTFRESLFAVLQALYDSGMRNGDLVMLAMEWLMPSIYDISDPNLLEVVKELTQGAIMIYPSSFIGTIGESLRQQYSEQYQQQMPTQDCYYYDATLSIAHALDYMSMKGMNWRDASELSESIRDARFIGCTGLVTIEKGTNDRSRMSYTILNARLQPDGRIEIKPVGKYDLSGVTLFEFSEEIQWSGSSTSVPKDRLENVPGCPFEPKHSVRYQPAVVFSAATILSICLLSLLCCAYIWKKYWNCGAKPLTRQTPASLRDNAVYIAIAVEAAQMLATGLELQRWTLFLQWSANLSAVRFQAFLSIGTDAYWCVFYISVGVVVFWVVSLLLAKIQVNHWCKYLCKPATTVTEVICPVLGDLCFLPIVSTLFAIFQCPRIASQHSEDPSLYQAYLEWDCNHFCWSQSHLILTVLSCICLLIFIPSAVYVRPAWQYIPASLHIHSSPAFLMLKSMHQVVIVAVDRALKAEYPTEACAAFLVLTVLFASVTLRIRPFNYSRANLWHFLSLLVVIYTALLHILYDCISSISDKLWLVLFGIGLFHTILFGLIYQRLRMPSRFTSRTAIDVTVLFRFMFSRGSKYAHIFERQSE